MPENIADAMSSTYLPPLLEKLLRREAPLHIIQNLKHLSLSTILPYLTNAIHAEHPTLTPFLYACKYGHTDLVELLLLQGHLACMPNIKEQNKTGLHYASENGHYRTVILLLDHGIFVDALTTHGWSPLHYATRAGYAPIVKVLIEQGGADLEKKTRLMGLTPLHIAIAEGRLDIVQLLIQLGANVNARNTNGATALHYIALSQEARTRAFSGIPGLTSRVQVSLGQRLVVFKYLLLAGADIEMVDNYQKTCRQYIYFVEIDAFHEKLKSLKIDREFTEVAMRENRSRSEEVKEQQEKIRAKQWQIQSNFFRRLSQVLSAEAREDDEDERYVHDDNIFYPDIDAFGGRGCGIPIFLNDPPSSGDEFDGCADEEEETQSDDNKGNRKPHKNEESEGSGEESEQSDEESEQSDDYEVGGQSHDYEEEDGQSIDNEEEGHISGYEEGEKPCKNEKEEEFFQQLYQESKTQERHTEVAKSAPSFLKRSCFFPLSLVWVSTLFLITAIYLKSVWPQNGDPSYH